jgi:hypothetical protein
MQTIRTSYFGLAMLFAVMLGNSAPLSAVMHKVEICHKERLTLSVDEHAVPAHLAHGDTVGACSDGLPDPF